MSATSAELGGRLGGRRGPGQDAGLAAVDDQRPRLPAGRHLRQPPGERPRVVVAAGQERAHVAGHDVDLLERGRDGARRQRLEVGRAGADTGIDGHHRSLARDRHHHRGGRARCRAARRGSRPRRRARGARTGPARSSPSGATSAVFEPEPAGADRRDGAAAGRAQHVAGEALLPRPGQRLEADEGVIEIGRRHYGEVDVQANRSSSAGSRSRYPAKIARAASTDGTSG